MLSQLTLIFDVFVSFCIIDAPGDPIASLDILISSSSFVFIFLINNFGIASDFSPLMIKSSKKSNPPITVSVLEGMNSSKLLMSLILHFNIFG